MSGGSWVATASARADVQALASRLRSALPRGQTLPDEVWEKRHRALFVLLCLHVPAIFAFGLAEHERLSHAFAHGGALATLATLAYVARRRRRQAAVIVSIGLMTASASLVHQSGGVIETHFHFFVMIVVLSLYEDWLPFLLAAAYVVAHHGLAGLVDSHAVYNHQDAVEHPWKWALIHGGFVTAAGIASVAAWRMNETVRAEAQAAADLLAYQARHDALTGLPNRRQLVEDLDDALGRPDRPRLLLLLDLDGFKDYNDSFGHPAGDELLTRLGRRLAEAMAESGCSYRMGGDEFCVIAAVGQGGEAPIVARARAALSERGEAFTITASCGSAVLGIEGATAADVLGLADRRMYACKGRESRASAARQTTDVLLQVLSERSPDLGTHLDQVTELCKAVGESLELAEEEMGHLLRAASLHDIGKAAIPESILAKAGPLDAEEWSYIRRHTEIGERILAAAPALEPAARLVRASHERFDGSGYPDGLRADGIPLGARIIAACDAFQAMTAGRPYRAARSSDRALDELLRCSGSQFDPAVVQALAEVLAAREEHPLAVGLAAPASSG